MSLQFEWDDTKARTNLAKHRVSFEEASTVFGDELSLTIYDPEHSTEEDRFVAMGISAFGKVLVGPRGWHPDHQCAARVATGTKSL